MSAPKGAAPAKSPLWLWAPRIIAAGIMAMAAYHKLSDAPGDVALFTSLGMEPHGRLLVGVIEAGCAALLVSPFAAVGGVLTSAVMTGALITHVTKIGFMVNGEPMVIGALAVVMLAALTVAYVRRFELPLFGDTL